MQLVADFPDLFGANLDPPGPTEHDYGGVGRMQPGDDLAEVVEISWGVDQVDLGVEPFGIAEGRFRQGSSLSGWCRL
jgi:hypothetical protein